MSAVASWALEVAAVVLMLGVGAYAATVLESAIARIGAGVSPGPTLLLAPLRKAAWLAKQQTVRTERPDVIGWMVATAGLLPLAALAASLIPLSSTWVMADFESGIVLWGAVEALIIVVVFLRGWSPNSTFSLIGGYRFVIQAFSYTLLSMFVLIAAALPAQSLSIQQMVVTQQGLPNLVKQPLGLPLWIVIIVGVSFRGPLNLPDGRDLAGGTSVESSGWDRLLWEAGRAPLLVVFSAMGATIFLGGWLGPWLPGPVWVAVKTLVVLLLALVVAQALGRFRPESFVEMAWTVLLPVGFIHLFQAGVTALP
ncbi:MAG: NADH-quinone oxidoreductase subunit H [Actinobacteria bacterium]|nr:NADH-quinone oxidoreductase subunit H [Actinomycetota bacterium]